jgi:protein-disulfide isomerase
LEAAAVMGAGAVVLSQAPFGQWIAAAQAQAPAPAAPAVPSAQLAKDLLEPGPLGDQSLGSETAPVTLVEYASMTCSHCATFHTTTYPHLKTRYIDTGKVRYILREFPLDPLAEGAFMLARCAGKEKYFALVETLFREQAKWAFVRNPIPPLFAVAKQNGFNEQSFEKCLSDQALLDGIQAVRQRGAEKFGVNSTPTFFINGVMYRGALTVEELDKQVEPFLKS